MTARLTPPWCRRIFQNLKEAAGLIGRVWIWKPNKVTRKVPKIAEGESPS